MKFAVQIHRLSRRIKSIHMIARAMTELGEWEDAMFQNSPWAGAWR
jgi:hypothetical protein